MSTILADLVSTRGLLLYLAVLVVSPEGSHSSRGGYINFQFLCFKNPGHLDYQGKSCGVISKRCDPFFIICISNRPINSESSSNCPVLYSESEPFDNQESVCNRPRDNRGYLRTFPNIELPYPLQESYYVRIVVKDKNTLSADGFIAVFSSTIRTNPSPNDTDFKYKPIAMTRSERKVGNPKARMEISLAFKCDKNLFGNLCAIICRATPLDNFICSKNGEKICKSGWKGADCRVKDLCKNKKCAKGAVCVLVDNVPRCACNGTIGPECSPNYNPCHPNPCKNGGKCILERGFSGGISCNCMPPYHGSRCSEKFNLCEIEPCRNNGTCILHEDGSRSCKCLPRFKGALCDSPNNALSGAISNVTSSSPKAVSVVKSQKALAPAIIYPAIGLLCICIISVLMYIRCYRKQRKRRQILIKKTIEMKNIPLPIPRPSTPNEYVTCTDEVMYDTIDDKATYIYQLDNKDDYLVPSKATSPAVSANIVTDSSDYIPMFNNDNLYNHNDSPDGNKADEDIRPPLPLRKVTKKRISLFCNQKQ